MAGRFELTPFSICLPNYKYAKGGQTDWWILTGRKIFFAGPRSGHFQEYEYRDRSGEPSVALGRGTDEQNGAGRGRNSARRFSGNRKGLGG